MISWRNRGIRFLLQFIFKIAKCFIALGNFFQRRRKSPLLTGLPASYEDQIERLENVFSRMSEPKYWAQTSGTRKAPKLIPYDRMRTKLLQKTFMKSMITLTAEYSGQKTFFVFSALNQDQSLTSGLMDKTKEPNLIELLQAPYRYLQTADGQDLRLLVGDLSARVIVLLVTQPRFLYATNPSTITHFISEYETQWKVISQGMKQVLVSPKILNSILKLADGDAKARLMKFSALASASPLEELLPEWKAVISWDGGYVGVFLEQLRNKFPYLKFIPMFSMSTEALETIPHRIQGKIFFLPTAPGTYAEFLDLDGRILKPEEVEVHKIYTLLISDAWGLVRYDTQDLFLVKGMIGKLPDLKFLKRRGMTSSLTGEKVTEEQVLLLGLELKKEFPAMVNSSLSLYPIERNGVFGYQLALIGLDTFETDLSHRAELILREINTEYASKVDSGRLMPLKITKCSAANLAKIMGNEDNWESQFKIVPLYEKIIKAD